jgi:three-Cys-motif partner protein
MPPRTTRWEIESHTKAKHTILRRYLQAWLPMVTSWNRRVVYIDGFAGPGIYSGGEEGSPIIALKEAIKHPAKIEAEIVFIFIEADEDRFESLKQQTASLSAPANFKIYCFPGKFDDRLTQVLNLLAEQKKRLAPTFAFVDPFGFSHTPFSLIQRLMQNTNCEVLITFMYEATNRFLSHRDQPENYDVLMGCTDWRNGISLRQPGERKKFIHDLYLNQLNTTGGIKYVRSFEMLDRGNRTEYFLFFGTNHYQGLKKMKEAMWKADETGSYQFSDNTDMTQELLFQNEPAIGDLQGKIVNKFSGRQVTVDEVERYVVEETPYREIHFKPILKQMELASEPSLRVIKRKSPNRKGTFPGGTVVQFL